MKVILVSFLLLGVTWAALNCECGKRNAGRIIGGKETKKNEYPWMVALQRPPDNFTYCGGTILTPRHIVTASHCVGKLAIQKKEDVVLVAGAHDVNDLTDSTSQRLYVDQIIVHEDSTADLALVVTTTEIIFNEFVGPACMPSGVSRDQLNDQMVKAMGWGRYNPRQANRDKVKKLREVDLEVVSSKECRESELTKICTYFKNKAACMGDSGGPIVWLDPETNRFTFLGVIIMADCGEWAEPGVSTSMIHYQDWINANIERTVNGAVTCHKV